MVILVRVDDRLLHGQIICAWVPYIQADSLIVASDEAAKDSLVSEIIESCGCNGLTVKVKNIEDAVNCVTTGACTNDRVILIVGDLQDAMKVYQTGMRFTSLNLGNIHHEEEGRQITPSVILNSEDEAIIENFRELGVAIDIRDVPASPAAAYSSKKRKPC